MVKIKRVGAPTRTTKGSVGDTYIDLKARKAYICTSAYRDSTGSVDYTWREKENEEVAEDDLTAMEETPKETPKQTFDAPVIEDVEEPSEKKLEQPRPQNPNQKRNYNQYHKR